MLKKLSEIINKSSSIDDYVISRLTSYSSNKIENKISSFLKIDSQEIINYDQILGSENVSVITNSDGDLVISLIDNSTKELNLELSDFPIIIRNKHYSFSLNVLGEYVAPLKYKISNLPPGLTFNEETNIFSGVCNNNGVYYPIFILSDATGAEVKIIKTLQVRNLKLTINIPDNYLEQIYNGNISCRDGIPPYIYSIENLPNGLVLDQSTGYISGMATEFGNFNLKIKATDLDNNIVEESKLLTIEEVYYNYDPNVPGDGTIAGENPFLYLGTPFVSPSRNTTYYFAQDKNSYSNIGGSAADPWRVFYPDTGAWCHVGESGWIVQKFGELKKVWTIISKHTANGTGARTIDYYALTTPSDNTGTLIVSKQYNITNSYGTGDTFIRGVNINKVPCYGIRIATTCINGGGNYSIINGPITIYCE
jgi:hypothetical protein